MVDTVLCESSRARLVQPSCLACAQKTSENKQSGKRGGRAEQEMHKGRSNDVLVITNRRNPWRVGLMGVWNQVWSWGSPVPTPGNPLRGRGPVSPRYHVLFSLIHFNQKINQETPVQQDN